VRNHRVFPPSVMPAIPASPTLGTSHLVRHRPAGQNPVGQVCRKAYPSPSSRRTRPRAKAGVRGLRRRCVTGCRA
jgi:hypothetical protein